jgi:hypothetical protein
MIERTTRPAGKLETFRGIRPVAGSLADSFGRTPGVQRDDAPQNRDSPTERVVAVDRRLGLNPYLAVTAFSFLGESIVVRWPAPNTTL